MKKLNPEFRRHLWTEFTLHRIIAMPLILAIFLLSNLSSHPIEMAATALIAYSLLLLWGVRNTSKAFSKEVHNNTWDLLKISNISPWQLVWGKLLGSSIFQWYGAVLTLAAFTVAVIAEIIMGGKIPLTTILLSYLNLIIASIVFLGIGLLNSSLIFWKETKTHSRTGQIISLLILGVFGFASLSIVVNLGYDSFDFTLQRISWYGVELSYNITALMVLSFSCFWILIANYRMVQRELQFRLTPVMWSLFLVSTVCFALGFYSQYDAHTLIFASSMIILTIVYIIALLEPKIPSNYLKLYQMIQQKQWKNALHVTPLWMVTLAISVLVAALHLPISLLQNDSLDSLLHLLEVYPTQHQAGKYSIMLICFFLLAIRDVGIILFFSLSNRRKNTASTAILYLTLLNIFFPLIVGGVTPIASMVFVPIPFFFAQGYEIFALITAVIHLVIMMILLRYRAKHYFTHTPAQSKH